MQPFRMSALELLSAYRPRELSPVEAMASVIERVEASSRIFMRPGFMRRSGR